MDRSCADLRQKRIDLGYEERFDLHALFYGLNKQFDLTANIMDRREDDCRNLKNVDKKGK